MPGDRADAAGLDGLLREIGLVRAPSGTDVPHAELIAADETGDLLGRPFYVMTAIDGWNSTGGQWPAPFDTDLQVRRGLAFELIDGAAKLGRVDWRAQGLDGFGRPDGFHQRQVDCWMAYLDSYRVRELPGLDEAADWLRRNRRGAEVIVDYEREDLRERIRDLTDGGAHAVLDPVGGRYSERRCAASGPGARSSRSATPPAISRRSR